MSIVANVFRNNVRNACRTYANYQRLKEEQTTPSSFARRLHDSVQLVKTDNRVEKARYKAIISMHAECNRQVDALTRKASVLEKNGMTGELVCVLADKAAVFEKLGRSMQIQARGGTVAYLRGKRFDYGKMASIAFKSQASSLMRIADIYDSQINSHPPNMDANDLAALYSLWSGAQEKLAKARANNPERAIETIRAYDAEVAALEKQIKFLDSQGMDSDAAVARGKLAGLCGEQSGRLMGLKNKDEAVAWLAKKAGIYGELSNIEQQAGAYREMIDVLRAQGKVNEAMEAYSRLAGILTGDVQKANVCIELLDMLEKQGKDAAAAETYGAIALILAASGKSISDLAVEKWQAENYGKIAEAFQAITSVSTQEPKEPSSILFPTVFSDGVAWMTQFMSGDKAFPFNSEAEKNASWRAVEALKMQVKLLEHGDMFREAADACIPLIGSYGSLSRAYKREDFLEHGRATAMRYEGELFGMPKYLNLVEGDAWVAREALLEKMAVVSFDVQPAITAKRMECLGHAGNAYLLSGTVVGERKNDVAMAKQVALRKAKEQAERAV